VARSTVYLVFGPRAGLFDALSDELLHGPGWEQLTASVRLPDAREGMRGALDAGVRMYAPHRDVLRVLVSLAHLDPEAVGGTFHRREAARARGIGRLSRRLAQQGHLRDGVTANAAADVIWLLAGFDAFDELYTGRRMGADRVAKTLVETAERSICR
jgi:AcrR family transcriptional regulator